MAYNLATLLNEAERDARKAVTLIDSDFAAAPTPPDPENQTAGQLLEKMAATGRVDPPSEVRKLRAKFYKRFQAAKALHDEAEEQIDQFERMAKYLRTGQADLSDLPPDMLFALRAVKAGSGAGLADPEAIANQIDHALRDCRDRVAVERLHLRRLEAVGVLAAVSQAGQYYGRCGKQFAFAQSGFERRAKRIKGYHMERARLAKEAKRRLSGKSAPKSKSKRKPVVEVKRRRKLTTKGRRK